MPNLELDPHVLDIAGAHVQCSFYFIFNFFFNYVFDIAGAYVKCSFNV